jgi:phenylacetate-CoA ligase
VSVELTEAGGAADGLADAIGHRIRELLLVRTAIELVPWGSLQRSEYKSKLVERP